MIFHLKISLHEQIISRLDVSTTSKKNAEDKVPIYVRVTIDGDYEDFSLSKRVNPDDWSQANC